ncbi:MAG TPA: TetR/AcrR family transcriptional regulator [bacterium]|jgi:AcrR family transcriptional regulator|nr:TetR/AcrR family transcriptional regulator [bacterium]
MRTVDPLAHARSRAKILDAARHVFAGQGYHAASMNDVARKAGLAKAAVYHYFPGKHALLDALHQDLWTEAGARLASAPRPRSLRQALRYLGGEYVSHFQEKRHSEMMRIAFNVSVVEPELLRLSSGTIMPRLEELMVGFMRPVFPKGSSPRRILLHLMPFIGALFHYLFVVQQTCGPERMPATAEEYLERLVDIFATLPPDKKSRAKDPS